MIRRFANFDWVLFGALLSIALTSLLSLASVEPLYFGRQLIWYALAFAVIFLGSQLDWRWLGSQTWFRHGLYFLSITLLIISNLQSRTIRGTKSWLVFGGLQFEPVELAKLALIIILAHFFSKRYIAAWQGRNIFASFFYTILPVVLVLFHPDFGSAVVVLGIWSGFLFASGINKKRLAVGLLIAIMLCIFLWAFAMKPYQKERIMSFIFPERDPLGTSYNVIQSKIAIGSGGLWGKGFGGGTQAKLHFLPAAHTDFLFAAFAEEWGVVGGVVLIGLYGILIFRVVRIGLRGRDNYARFLALGAGILLTIHFLINVGSNMGLLPVTGIPLLFFSYGGSSLLTVAILMSIMEHIQLESSA
ncbi:rod shape-determining protein RodA [Candidatus Jorgensenbacteria bacterium]|nr:rod shape-determining protein RodA [Candidatus Jorgensenbacteria bacterium]